MSFKILLLAPDADPSWQQKIRQAVPGGHRQGIQQTAGTSPAKAAAKMPQNKGPPWRWHKVSRCVTPVRSATDCRCETGVR